jgi:hypothetical protein
MRRLLLGTAAALAVAACNRGGGDAAADSAAIPNTAADSTGKIGPVGDSLSSAAAGATVAPNAGAPPGPDSARPDSVDGVPTGGRTTRPQ